LKHGNQLLLLKIETEVNLISLPGFCFYMHLKEKTAFHRVLKRRAHMLLIASVGVQNNRQLVAVFASEHLIYSSEYASETFEDVFATIKRGRNDQGSLPCPKSL
jgi:hypothetical protein